MPAIRIKVVQTAVDVFTSVPFDTNIEADGKVGWQIKRMHVFWSDGYLAPAADISVSAILTTQLVQTTPDLPNELSRVNWAVANTGGVAVAYPVELKKTDDAVEGRITVQPRLYAQVSSVGTGAANTMFFEVEYDLIRLTELEVLRLLVGGA